MKSVARALAPAVTKAAASVPSFRTTTLCDMAILGMVPFGVSLILICSPGLASMVVLSYFMSSDAEISIVRGPACAVSRTETNVVASSRVRDKEHAVMRIGAPERLERRALGRPQSAVLYHKLAPGASVTPTLSMVLIYARDVRKTADF